MKNLKKKGFTIVELVIVIAVIAILAAVLIPTFVNLTKKANQSADIQATRQMNTALAVAGELNDIDAVIDALAEAGYNSKEALIPVSTGYAFYWNAETKQIVLVNENNEVVFPEGVDYNGNGVSLENSVQYIDVVSNNKKDLFNAFQSGNKEIKLSGNVTVSSDTALVVPEEAEVTFDLNNNKLSAELQIGHSDRHINAISVKGKAIIKNGTIDTRNVYVYSGSELILENVIVNALDSDGGACVYVESGAKVIIKNCTLNTESFTYAVVNKGSDVTLENTNVNADRGCVSVDSGTVTIKGGIFNTRANNHGVYFHVVIEEATSMSISDVSLKGIVNSDFSTINWTDKYVTESDTIFQKQGTNTVIWTK